jgi:hypothetical protein
MRKKVKSKARVRAGGGEGEGEGGGRKIKREGGKQKDGKKDEK